MDRSINWYIYIDLIHENMTLFFIYLEYANEIPWTRFTLKQMKYSEFDLHWKIAQWLNTLCFKYIENIEKIPFVLNTLSRIIDILMMILHDNPWFITYIFMCVFLFQRISIQIMNIEPMNLWKIYCMWLNSWKGKKLRHVMNSFNNNHESSLHKHS